MSGYIFLTYWDVAIAALLLVANGALSLWLDLRLERQLVIAAVRMTVQLILVGFILEALFAVSSPWLTLLAGLVMAGFAGREVLARQDRRFAGWWAYGLGGAPMVIAGGLTILLALTLMLRPEPWYAPRYALPLFGMILGNAMTGVSLGLNTLTTTLARERLAIEAQLLLGASRLEAAGPFLRQALRSGFMPIINAMAATGIVSLPGMMTGQILAGADPTEAVKYQLLIMFLIAGATGAGVLLAVLGALWRITDERHRLRLERLAPMGVKR